MRNFTRKLSKFEKSISQNQGKVLCLCLALMLILWLLTIATTHIYHFPPDPFYYAKQMPPYYWLGIAIAGIVFSWLIYRPLSRRKELAEITFIAILILYLFGTSSFIYTITRFFDVHGICGVVEEAIKAGSATLGGVSVYKGDFPGSILLYSSIGQTSGIDITSVAKYFPIYLMFTTSLLIYAISRKITKKYCFFAPVAYLSLAWVQAYHMTPQPHAFMLTLTWLLLLLLLFMGERAVGSTISKQVLFILTWIAILISHPSTPILNLLALALFFLCYTFIKYLPRLADEPTVTEITTRTRTFLNSFVLFIVTYLYYLLYNSDYIFRRLVHSVEMIVNNVLYEEVFFVTVDRVVTTPAQSYLLCYNIRWFIIVGTIALGLSGIIYLWLKNKDRISTFLFGSMFLGYISLGVGLVATGHVVYGTDRSYLFCLIPFSVLGSMVIATKLNPKDSRGKYFSIFKGLFTAFIIMALFLFPITKYGSDPYEFVPESVFAGRMKFLRQYNIESYSGFDIPSYNLAYLKRQEGEKFMKRFDSNDLIKIYTAGQCAIYLPVSK